MARKYDLISELYEQTAFEVTQSEEQWKAFLSTAGRNFRLRFDEQLLIYAQRPDAIAVLEIEKWNKNFGRWVNKGAKGIAVFVDENRDTQRLNHYFDISDTHASRYSIPVPIWSMKDDYKQEVIETLENTFGQLSQKTSFEDAIKESINHAIEDNISDYLEDLPSILPNYPYEELTLAYKTFVTNSVGYMMMIRLGINADLYYSNDDFKNINYFQSHDGLNAIGFATSDIAEMGLMPISKTINALDKQNRTIVSHQQNQYNKAKENERSQHDERTSLQHGGRLQSTQPNITEPTRSDSRQMGENEKNLSQGTSQDPLLQPINEGNLDHSSSRNSTTGNESREDTYQQDVQGSRSERDIESQGYDEMGTDDQQHSSFSSGNREGTSDLQLNILKPLPSYQEQMSMFESQAVELSSTAFSIPQEVIDSTIAQGSGFVDGKMRIYEQFQKSLSQKENAEFLKKEYGTGGSSSAGGFDGYHQDHDSKGLKITKGYAKGAPTVLLKWNQVAKRVDELIKVDRYLNAKEKERYPQWLEEITAKRLEEQERKQNKEILSTVPSEDIIGKELTIDDHLFIVESISSFSQDVSLRDVTFQNNNGYPINRVEKLPYIQRLINEQYPQAEKEKIEVVDVKYEYHLGDKVYLGANEYEILSFDEKRVMLYDFDMPLFNKELTREEFDLKVKENPLNDHLIVKETNKPDLASRIMTFIKDYDFYEYKDNLDANETDEDVIQKINELLVDKESAKGITTYFEAIDGEDLEYEDFVEYDSILNELHNLRDLLKEAKTLIDDYCREEFDSEDGADYSDLSNIGVAYTETDEGYPIQAIVDLNNFKIETEVMGVITHLEQYSSLEELVDKGLPNLDFSELTYISEEDEARIEEAINAPSKIEAPSWEKKKSKVKSFDLYPNIPMTDRNTFNLKEHPVEVVGKKERFKRNIQAIRLLNTLEKEERFATTEEQEILSKYVGWGGIPEAFDDRNSAWANEYQELKSVLDNEAYLMARQSTLTAFYTPPEVIQAIYKAMEQMGFKEGNLLEPSCGVGNFIGLIPESMQNSRIYGVELDPTSAHIAQQLYQKSSIAPLGFEEVNVPDSFFDGVIGNVPFGDFKVFDKRYDKHHFLIHDYFFAKSLDKLRPGGVMALITSKGTMDKENSSVRKYIAQRAELIGAIRLPNDTFKGNAGTEVVSDILFLQKRDRLMDIEPHWVHLGTNENGIKLNNYFIDHPEMILGEMKKITGRYGPEVTCEPYPQSNLSELLDEAISNIHAEIKPYEINEDLLVDNSIPANPDIRNFSYAIMNDEIYYRENSLMSPVECSQTAKNRIKGMIQIRDTVRHLIELQTEDYPESEFSQAQKQLNEVYDSFTKKYGLINSRANSSAFGDDSSYALLSALEIINENGELERKADMFTKRTIKPHVPVTEVDSASEALALSIGEKACIDMYYMEELTHKSEEQLFSDLKGTIFLNPRYNDENPRVEKYLMADEYLSGNVREKLREAKLSQQLDPESFKMNVEALEKVQPKDLTASEISVRLGATWLPPQIIKQFVFELLDTPYWAQRQINIQFSNYTSEWRVEGKKYDRSNVKAYSTYGTGRINAYQIIEDTLNLKDVRIIDYIEDESGKKKPVLNKKETAIAQAKQELIKQGFQDWIWQDPTRREKLTTLYNEKFNSIRPREYDGSHIIFNGMNPEINLREHQRNAVAHILYGGNTLLAHAVGAGKTFEMVAASQESKRLGLCNKSLFVVPNHLTEQWAAEYLQLYPAANILVATKKDFETKNRKKFCGRIATGDYDAIIIGHSQFEKIPMSIERQRATLENQLEEITDGILELRRTHGESFSIKQLEKSRRSIKQKLEKLNDQSKKDDVVTFEELGVDRLFIDESHYYKNLYLYTKMRNVGGIAQTEAQKSSDLFMKCRYLDEITGGRGVVFATGTPISNSMVELYTIQRYLQYNTLLKNNLQHFDAWASTFGETVTAVELTPEGYTFIGR